MFAMACDGSSRAAVASRPVGEFVVEMVVVHVLLLAVPLDAPNVAVALVQVCVTNQLAIFSAWPVDAKAIHCVPEER